VVVGGDVYIDASVRTGGIGDIPEPCPQFSHSKLRLSATRLRQQDASMTPGLFWVDLCIVLLRRPDSNALKGVQYQLLIGSLWSRYSSDPTPTCAIAP